MSPIYYMYHDTFSKRYRPSSIFHTCAAPTDFTRRTILVVCAMVFGAVLCLFGAASGGEDGLEDEIAAKTAKAAKEMLAQLERRGLLTDGKTVMCVLPTRDAYGKVTVLGKSAGDALSRALLSDSRLELATELSVGATDFRISGTLYEMEGRRVGITFRCGNNPADPFSEQRYQAMASIVVVLPVDAKLRLSLLSSAEDARPLLPAAAAVSPTVAVRCQRRLEDGSIVTEALPLTGGFLRSGEQFQLELRGDADEDCYVYVIWRDPGANYQLVWPSGDAVDAGPPPERLSAALTMEIPRIMSKGKSGTKIQPGWFALDEQTGSETVFILAHASRKNDAAGFLSSLNALSPAERETGFEKWKSGFSWEKKLTVDHRPALSEAPADNIGAGVADAEKAGGR